MLPVLGSVEAKRRRKMRPLCAIEGFEKSEFKALTGLGFKSEAAVGPYRQTGRPGPGGRKLSQPAYKNSIWGLRVVDLETGKPLIDLEPSHQFFIGSVRKVFTIGELLNQVGPNHTYDTPIYRRGPIGDRGTLRGDLILVASGDLTMGGRTNPDGSIAVSDYDHNEAGSLGNAQLTKPDPLAGYAALARQIAASGIKEVDGDAFHIFRQVVNYVIPASPINS
jgi:D-alanyl-D-alanine carboxypeptidase